MDIELLDQGLNIKSKVEDGVASCCSGAGGVAPAAEINADAWEVGET